MMLLWMTSPSAMASTSAPDFPAKMNSFPGASITPAEGRRLVIPLIEAQGRKGRPATAPADRGKSERLDLPGIAAAVSPAEGPFVRFKVSEEGREALMLGLKIDA
jgi:hypothetical protein